MRNTTLVIFALAVALLAGLAFREARAARQARAALDTAVGERDALRARVAKLEKDQEALAAEYTSLHTAATTAAAALPPPASVKTFTTAVPRGRRPRPMEAFDSPEMRQLMAVEQKGRLDARYAALFKALRLPPDQLDRLKQLLVDKQNAAMDVLSAAHRQDMLDPGNGADIPAMMKQEQNAIDYTIRDLLGETAYEEYQDYERTRAQRDVVDQLASRLSYTDSPLSTEQAETLVDLLSAERSIEPQPNTPPVPETGMRVAISAGSNDTMVSFSAMGPGNNASISDASLASAQTVLSETQLAAFLQLQAEQLAQQQMMDLIRESMPMPGAGGAAWVEAVPVDLTESPLP